jgi:hypothetical protein
VTNQELRLAEREDLRTLGGDTEVELYHLERVTTIIGLALELRRHLQPPAN